MRSRRESRCSWRSPSPSPSWRHFAASVCLIPPSCSVNTEQRTACCILPRSRTWAKSYLTSAPGRRVSGRNPSGALSALVSASPSRLLRPPQLQEEGGERHHRWPHPSAAPPSRFVYRTCRSRSVVFTPRPRRRRYCRDRSPPVRNELLDAERDAQEPSLQDWLAPVDYAYQWRRPLARVPALQ
jgi:hypothetical protein